MKIPQSKENPLDNINIWLVDKLCPAFKQAGMCPNHITTLSLVFGILSIMFIWKYNWIGFAICYYISYMFDCMDGHYARKYGMVSKWGDYYDHIKDILVIIGLLIVVVKRFSVPRKTWIIFISIMTVFTLLMIAQLGCQEKLYPHEESPTLNKSKLLCPGDANKNIRYTRWFGCGTWTVVLILSIYYLNRQRYK